MTALQIDQNSQLNFWNQAAKTKGFNDPFYLEKLQPYLHENSVIIEYGCGYGRLLNLLYTNGFRNTLGFDFSPAMIERGQRTFPQLNLNQIQHASLPLEANIADAAILSTVLCCVPETEKQIQIISSLKHILKPGGVLYFTDFLITDSQNFQVKYQRDFETYKEWGTYQTNENAIVGHFTPEHVMQLMKDFHSRWYQEENFVTMNNNPIKTFHGIFQLIK